MANKAISELPQAQNVNNQDLFVLEQSGIAKKLPAETFITEQGIINALAEALDGHGGIQSVTLSSVSGRIRTYRITFTDQSATTFQVYDGTSIDRISRTSSSGLDDVYTIFLSDGTTTFFTVHNGADGTVSEAMLNDAVKDKAPAVTETTESSAIANFPDGADDLVMHNIVVEIAPVQSGSGDPSPSNIRPISGWTGCNVTRTGKNLLPNDKYQRTTSMVVIGQTDDSYTTALKAGTYTVSLTTSTIGTIYLNRSDGTSERVGNYNATQGSFTLNKDETLRVVYYNSSGISASDITSFQLELGSTATTYEPYIAPATASLSWQTEAGTVYGGTIDVATGLLTVDSILYTFTGNEAQYIQQTGRVVVQIAGTPNVKSNCPAICSDFSGVLTASSRYAYIPTTLTAEEMRTYMQTHTVQMVYVTTVPQTYQLSGQQLMTLLGTNNVWTDIGNVSVTYPADTKLYIEKLTQPTEDDMTADHAISSGTFFMLGNNLYLATAAIASGATIIEGTNATRLSLADALNRLS